MKLVREAYTIQPHRIVGQIIEILKLVGIWGTDSRFAVINFLTKTIHFLLSTLLCIAIFVGSLTSDDSNESLFLAAASVAAGIHSVKLIYVLAKKDQLLSFFDDVCVHSVSDAKELNKVQQTVNNFAKFGFVYMIFVVVGIVGFYIVTLPNFSTEVALPFKIGFPLDWKHNRMYYWFAYFFVIGGIFTAGASSYFTIIYWYTLFNCSIKYKILGNRFRALGTGTETPLQGEIFYPRIFVELVTDHQIIRK